MIIFIVYHSEKPPFFHYNGSIHHFYTLKDIFRSTLTFIIVNEFTNFHFSWEILNLAYYINTRGDF